MTDLIQALARATWFDSYYGVGQMGAILRTVGKLLGMAINMGIHLGICTVTGIPLLMEKFMGLHTELDAFIMTTTKMSDFFWFLAGSKWWSQIYPKYGTNFGDGYASGPGCCEGDGEYDYNYE